MGSLWTRPAGRLMLWLLLAIVAGGVFTVTQFTRPYRMSRLTAFLGTPSELRRRGIEFRRFETAWIFVGYAEPVSRSFVEGPYAHVAFRAGGSERGAVEPRVGDVLQVVKDRRLIISDFRRRGTALERTAPPLAHAVLTEDDDTGFAVQAGNLVIVRDVEISGDPGRPVSVWCRVADCDAASDACRQALEGEGK